MAYSDQRRSQNLPLKSQLEKAITDKMSNSTFDAIIESNSIKWGIRAGVSSFGIICVATWIIASPRSNIAFAIMDYFHYLTTDLQTFSTFLGWAVLSGIIGVLSYRAGTKASKVIAKNIYAAFLIEKGMMCSSCKEPTPPESVYCPHCGAKQVF